MTPLTAGDLSASTTIVMITRNRRSEATRTVQQLLQIPACPRIIVIDNASHDGSADALAALGRGVDVVRLSRNAGAAGRNIGVELARTPYVAFCDDDTYWEPESLLRAVRHLDQEPALAVVNGRVLVGDDETLDELCVEMERSPLGSGEQRCGVQVLGFMAGASVVRRSALLEVGGFAEPFGVGGEEELVALDLAAAGWTLRYAPDVVVRHYPSAVRDRGDRRRIVLRNRFWTALLRYPLRLLLRDGARLASESGLRVALRVAGETLRATPWLLSHRRQLPQRVVRQVELLRAT